MINPLDIIRKYYTLDSLAGQSLLIHSQLVRDKAQSLAIRHPEMDLDIPFIQEAAMLHDIGIFLTKAPDIGCFGEHPYICHGYLGADLLRRSSAPCPCMRTTYRGWYITRNDQKESFTFTSTGHASCHSRRKTNCFCRQVLFEDQFNAGKETR